MKNQFCTIFVLALTVIAFASRTGHAEPPSVMEPPVETKIPVTARPVPKDDNAWWMGRHASMNKCVAEGNVDLLMIGDSITQGWEGHGKKVWAKHYAERNAVNLGISGDRTEHVLWRLQNGNIKGVSPKLAVLMIGTNNAGDNTSEEIAQGVEAIVTLLREELPKTKILVLAIFPHGEKPTFKRRIVNDGVNKIIQNLADDEMIFYLDINKAFLTEDGILTKDIMPDYLHPQAKGYGIWAKAMEPTLKELLEPKPVETPKE